MDAVTPAPYGTWPSPLTPHNMAAAGLRLADPGLIDGRPCWVEGRPQEGGRCVLCAEAADGAVIDLTPAPYSVRTRVNEYGGRAVLATGAVAYFFNDADRCLYVVSLAAPEPVRITDPDSPWALADFCHDRARARLLAVGERGTADGMTQAIVAITLDTGAITPLITGADFYAAPRLALTGDRFAYMHWSLATMPWDVAGIGLAHLDADGAVISTEPVFDQPGLSAQQPVWVGEQLLFIADHDGWWTPHRWDGSRTVPIPGGAIDHGEPLWQLGLATVAAVGDDAVVMGGHAPAGWRPRLLAIASGAISDLTPPFSQASTLVPGTDGTLVALAGFSDRPPEIGVYDWRAGTWRCVRAQGPQLLAADAVSHAQPVEATNGDGAVVYGYFYPPTHPTHQAPADERPPLIVLSHGGPTAATSPAFAAKIQFWTSRGIAVLDVNYSGSTGYGRAYRDRLHERWGLADVDDCIALTQAMVAQGKVDGSRLAIAGSSAGGYTTLCALTFTNVFQAGISRYGVSDLERLALDTHRFESRYLDWLIAPYPERADVYRARAPIAVADRLGCPVLFLQGEADKVVPPQQARAMAAALADNDVPHVLTLFKEEGHGFRRQATQITAAEQELAFLGDVFGFTPADDLPRLDWRGPGRPGRPGG